MEACKKLQE